MSRKFIALVLFGVLLGSALSSAQARGRRPDEEEDSFPDYNKLEMRSKPRTPQTSTSTVTNTPVPNTAPPPASPPTLNTPVNTLPEQETAPEPPPKAVPLPDGASEPPLPDDIRNTLMQATTDQNNQK